MVVYKNLNFLLIFKHSIVLPKGHHVTGLVVIDEHVRCGHFTASFVLNELLAKYHIVGRKAIIKYYLKKLYMNYRNPNADIKAQ